MTSELQKQAAYLIDSLDWAVISVKEPFENHMLPGEHSVMNQIPLILVPEIDKCRIGIDLTLDGLEIALLDGR